MSEFLSVNWSNAFIVVFIGMGLVVSILYILVLILKLFSYIPKFLDNRTKKANK